jgi:hypothetical protein
VLATCFALWRGLVGRYPLRCHGEQVFKIAAACRLIDVGVYLVLPDASIAHGHGGAAQDGKRAVVGKKPDFDVRKFSIQVVQPLAFPGFKWTVLTVCGNFDLLACASLLLAMVAATKVAGNQPPLLTRSTP